MSNERPALVLFFYGTQSVAVVDVVAAFLQRQSWLSPWPLALAAVGAPCGGGGLGLLGLGLGAPGLGGSAPRVCVVWRGVYMRMAGGGGGARRALRV